MATLKQLIQAACDELGARIYNNYPYNHKDNATGVVIARHLIPKFQAHVITALYAEVIDEAEAEFDADAGMDWATIQDRKECTNTTVELLLDYKIDTMGYDMIIYWPSLVIDDEPSGEPD